MPPIRATGHIARIDQASVCVDRILLYPRPDALNDSHDPFLVSLLQTAFETLLSPKLQRNPVRS